MKMHRFRYDALPARVRFGAGSVSRIADEAEALGLKRLIVISTEHQSEQADQIASLLDSRSAGIFDGAAMHTPIEVTDRAMEIVKERNVDGLIAVGGGSAIGLAKAIALRTDLPQIVVPTTYAGSEATPIIGQTENGHKTTQRTLKVLPEVIIYDVELTLSLPVAMSMTSGFNAIAHAAEALYARDANPLVSLMAKEGIASLLKGLILVHGDPERLEGRSLSLYGAWLCGVCLGSVGMALHHKICHTLGGSFDLPHAETHAIMLPHTLAYNLSSAPEAESALAQVVGRPDPAVALYELAARLNIPRRLMDIGMPHEGIARAAELAVSNPYDNPREIDETSIADMLERAWLGERPAE